MIIEMLKTIVYTVASFLWEFIKAVFIISDAKDNIIEMMVAGVLRVSIVTASVLIALWGVSKIILNFAER